MRRFPSFRGDPTEPRTTAHPSRACGGLPAPRQTIDAIPGRNRKGERSARRPPLRRCRLTRSARQGYRTASLTLRSSVHRKHDNWSARRGKRTRAAVTAATVYWEDERPVASLDPAIGSLYQEIGQQLVDSFGDD